MSPRDSPTESFRARPGRAPGHAGSAFPGGCLSAARGSGSSPLSFQAGPGVCGEGIRLLTVFGFSSLFHVVVSELQPLDSPWVSTATVSERGCRAGARVGEPRPASSSSHRPSAAEWGFSPAWRSTGVPFRLLCSSRSHFMFKNVFYLRTQECGVAFLQGPQFRAENWWRCSLSPGLPLVPLNTSLAVDGVLRESLFLTSVVTISQYTYTLKLSRCTQTYTVFSVNSVSKQGRRKEKKSVFSE